MSLKTRRQQAIARLIEQSDVASQVQLVELLSADGITATQATVSRDLDDLGAIKVRTSGGSSVYALPAFAPDRVAPLDQLRRVMGEWVAEVVSSHNLVIVRTPPGCAHVVASALDRSALDGLIGTVAGDDTVMCIASESTTGSALAERLIELAGIEGSGDDG
jgi:transcriptional regulator of arginine metabolism